MADAKQEREQWQTIVSEQHKEAMQASDKSSDALQANTNILTEIATIIRRLK